MVYSKVHQVGCGKQRKANALTVFIPSKTATLVPEFAMEDLALGRIAALVFEFAMKDLPLGRTVMMMMIQFNKIEPQQRVSGYS